MGDQLWTIFAGVAIFAAIYYFAGDPRPNPGGMSMKALRRRIQAEGRWLDRYHLLPTIDKTPQLQKEYERRADYCESLVDEHERRMQALRDRVEHDPVRNRVEAIRRGNIES